MEMTFFDRLNSLLERWQFKKAQWVKELDDRDSDYSVATAYAAASTYDTCITQLELAMLHVPRWLDPVKDKPEGGQRVLFITKCGSYFLGDYLAQYGEWSEPFEKWHTSEILCWMPAPRRPREGELNAK